MTEDFEGIKEYLTITVRNKNMAFSRMNQNFTWAFAIITAILVVIIRTENFEENLFTWFLLNLSLLFWSIFFIRSCKEYTNQMRFVGLEKNCISHIFNIKIKDDVIEKSSLQKKIKEYHIDWYSPLKRQKIVWKVLWRHGFLGLLIAILVVWSYVARFLDYCDIFVWIILLLIGGSVFYLLQSLFSETYFKCRVVEESIEGLE